MCLIISLSVMGKTPYTCLLFTNYHLLVVSTESHDAS